MMAEAAPLVRVRTDTVIDVNGGKRNLKRNG